MSKRQLKPVNVRPTVPECCGACRSLVYEQGVTEQSGTYSCKRPEGPAWRVDRGHGAHEMYFTICDHFLPNMEA